MFISFSFENTSTIQSIAYVSNRRKAHIKEVKLPTYFIISFKEFRFSKMLKWSLLVLLALVPLFLVSDSFEIQKRIVNGSDSKRGQFPHYAFLLIHKNTGFIVCGGSLITDIWILTAAHCLYEANNATIHLGSLVSDNLNETGRDLLKATSDNFYIYPFYQYKLKWNDIALIKLPRPALLNKFVRPIQLPKTCDSNENVEVVTMGNGAKTSKKLEVTPILQFTKLRTTTLSECRKQYPILMSRWSVICAVGTKKESVCHGK